MLGNQLTFAAAVKNASDTAVSWSVNEVPGGSAIAGTITTAGIYTAPPDLPSPANVKVSATSHADTSKSAAASVTIQSDISVGLKAGATAVELGGTQTFQATLTSGGHPDETLQWSVSGPACLLDCGSVDAMGHYTAPRILPLSPTVMLTARSVADPAKQASTQITITSNFLLQLTAPSSIPAAGNAALIAMLTPVPGSNPSTVLAWSLSGGGCNGFACGTLTVETTQSAGGTSSTTSANYTAPSAAPTPNSITVTVTPQADPSKRVQANLSIQGAAYGVSVIVSPGSATRAINHRVTLTVQVSGTASTSVGWNVNGIAGGNTAVGEICAVGSNPCQVIMSGSASQVDYVAPAAIPSPDPVTIQAISSADATKIGSAQITVINHVLVSILPGGVFLAPLGVQAFTATVLGADNQNVVWLIQGSGCGAAGSCGAITPTGVYTAPGAAPVPDTLQVVAISSEDTAQSGTANVTISTGVNIVTLHPASVYAGAANGFTLKVIGSGFGTSNSVAASVLWIGGTARTTTCAAADECIAPVTAADVAQPGSVSVQIQNPDGKISNAVALVVAPPNVSDDAIPLTTGLNDATGKDIVVVEPTTAGVSVPGDDVDLNVAALGIFSTADNSCTLGGNPVVLSRPLSGVTTADVCLFSQSGLDVSMAYTVTGQGDVTVIAKQPVGLGIIHLTLQLPANALPSARTVFVQNTNLDKAGASGTLWVK